MFSLSVTGLLEYIRRSYVWVVSVDSSGLSFTGLALQHTLVFGPSSEPTESHQTYNVSILPGTYSTIIAVNAMHELDRGFLARHHTTLEERLCHVSPQESPQKNQHNKIPYQDSHRWGKIPRTN